MTPNASIFKRFLDISRSHSAFILAPFTSVLYPIPHPAGTGSVSIRRTVVEPAPDRVRQQSGHIPFQVREDLACAAPALNVTDGDILQ
jgi:hypothetical protein